MLYSRRGLYENCSLLLIEYSDELLGKAINKAIFQSSEYTNNTLHTVAEVTEHICWYTFFSKNVLGIS